MCVWGVAWGQMDPLEDCPCPRPCACQPGPALCPVLTPVGWPCGPPGTHTEVVCSQQVNMPYVMIPAFPPSHQPLPVAPESQLALPIQPIPCKPGEWGWERPATETVPRSGTWP